MAQPGQCQLTDAIVIRTEPVPPIVSVNVLPTGQIEGNTEVTAGGGSPTVNVTPLLVPNEFFKVSVRAPTPAPLAIA